MDLKCLNIFTKLLLKVQFNFNKDICDEIFKNDSDHLYQKWISCSNNLLHFINRLDKHNTNLLLSWIIENINT